MSAENVKTLVKNLWNLKQKEKTYGRETETAEINEEKVRKF